MICETRSGIGPGIGVERPIPFLTRGRPRGMIEDVFDPPIATQVGKLSSHSSGMRVGF
jgi:hypothetical protein